MTGRNRLTCAYAGVLLLVASAAGAGSDAAPTLRFLRDGVQVRELDLAALEAGCPVERVEVADPYYGRRKAFRALPLGCVLTLGFGEPVSALTGADFFLRALDGYVKPASGARLAEPGGHVAFADADRGPGGPAFEPIDRRQVDPGPFYLVWSGAGQDDPHRYPWPYQLASIEIAPFEREYPHTLPRSAPPGTAAWRGFAIFRDECIACHAINGEGGRVGPELNVPRSIVEYRPAEQIKAYVRDPASFRYTSMPPHPHLSDADLDALVAYFETMRTLKHDPGRATD